MKINRILKILVIVLVLLTILTNFTYATSGIMDKFGNKNRIDELDPNAKQTIDNTINRAIYITKLFVLAVAIIMLIVLGMKYMVASPGEKAEVKKNLIIYVLGASISFGAYIILGIIQHFVAQI